MTHEGCVPWARQGRANCSSATAASVDVSRFVHGGGALSNSVPYARTRPCTHRPEAAPPVSVPLVAVHRAGRLPPCERLISNCLVKPFDALAGSRAGRGEQKTVCYRF